MMTTVDSHHFKHLKTITKCLKMKEIETAIKENRFLFTIAAVQNSCHAMQDSSSLLHFKYPFLLSSKGCEQSFH